MEESKSLLTMSLSELTFFACDLYVQARTQSAAGRKADAKWSMQDHQRALDIYWERVKENSK